MRLPTIAAILALSGLLLIPVSAAVPAGPAVSPAAKVTLTWAPNLATTLPSNRDQLVEAYDPLLKEVVLFGGYNVSGYPLGDTWSFKAGVWKNLTANLSTSPGPRWAPGFTYDPALKGLVLFGGRQLSGFYNDTWLFDATGWHNITSTVAPSPRSGVALAWDASLGGLVLFGGGIGNVPAGSGSPWTYYNQTWILKGKVWTNLTPTHLTNPGARFEFEMTWDPKEREIVGFGGYLYSRTTASGKWMNDTWVLKGGAWAKLVTPSAPVAGTEEGGLTWFTTCKCIVFFGGGAPAPVGNQTWTFSGAHHWKNVGTSMTTLPQARANFGFADDEAAGAIVLFGGDEAPPLYAYTASPWLLT